MIVIKTYWGPSGSRKGATICKDDQGYYVRYSSFMKTLGQSKYYKRLSSCEKLAERHCNTPT